MKDENALPSLRQMKTGEFAQYSRCFGLDGLEVMSARCVEHSFAHTCMTSTRLASITEGVAHLIDGMSFVMQRLAHAT